MQNSIITFISNNYSHSNKIVQKLKNNNYVINSYRNIDQMIKSPTLDETDLILLENDKIIPHPKKWLEKIKDINPHIPTIILSDKKQITNAMEAIKAGAADFLSHPLELKELKIKIDKLIKDKKQLEKVAAFESTLERLENNTIVINKSNKMREFISNICEAGTVSHPVLLIGERGTRKELFARIIHDMSAHQKEYFISIDCTNPNEDWQYYPAFLYKALSSCQNLNLSDIDFSESGTIFLNNLGELSVQTQHKVHNLLLERNLINRNKFKRDQHVARLISGARKNLNKMVEKNEFTTSLLYQINTITLKIPPLRERREDIAGYIDYFIKKHSSSLGLDNCGISNRAFNKLIRYNFPGNVVELEKIIERGLILSNDGMIFSDNIMLNAGKQLSSIDKT